MKKYLLLLCVLMIPLMSHAIAVGETVTKEITTINGYYSTQNFTWTTSDSRLSLSPMGYACKITCAGYFSGWQEVKVTFQYKNYYGDSWHTSSRGWTFSCVKNQVYIHPSEMSLAVGGTGKVTHSFQLTNNYPSAVTTEYYSEQESIATVSSDGTVTGVSPGTTNIAVISNTTDEPSYCKVTITNVDPTGISLPSNAVCYINGNVTLEPTFTPSNAASTLSWWSDNTDVATVNASGTVSGVSKGTTKIWVRTDKGGYTSSCDVSVLDPADIKYLVLWDIYGSTTAFPLDEHPVITYDIENDKLVCKTTVLSWTFTPMNSIYKYTLETEEHPKTTGIESAKSDKGQAGEYFNRAGSLILDHYAPNSSISVYNVNGVLIANDKADMNGHYEMSTLSWPDGIYIIKIGNNTIKFIKK